MGFGEAAAGVVGAATCLALAAYGWNLGRGRGLSFLAGNQNDFFEDPASPAQLSLGRRMGAVLIALAVALAALMAVAVASPLLGTAAARPALTLAAVAVLASFAAAAGAILRSHRRAARSSSGLDPESIPEQGRKGEGSRQGGGMSLKAQQRIAFGALILLQAAIQITLIIAIATKSP